MRWSLNTFILLQHLFEMLNFYMFFQIFYPLFACFFQLDTLMLEENKC
jgi:hypothetical protein